MGPADVPLPPGATYVADAPALPDHWTAHDVATLLRSVVPGFDVRAFGAGLRDHGVSVDRRLRDLSRGQATQLQIAAALAARPRLIILDEPLARLDPLARHALIDELRDFMAQAEDRSVLLTSHDLDGMEQFADHLVVMDAGRCVLEGDVETLCDSHLLAEGALDPANPALIGPEAAGQGVRALVDVEDAPGLIPIPALSRAGLTDIVTHHLREVRGSAAR